MSEQSKYDNLLKQARGSAKYWIPQLCQALKEENSNLSNEDIRDRVMKDCISTWQKDTIRDALPDEYKDKLRSELGKRGRQKQLEQSEGTVTTEIFPDSNRAKDDSDSSTGKESQTFDRPKPEAINRLKSQLNNKDQELEEAKKRIAILQEAQNIEDIPQMVDNKIGPVKMQNLSKINDFDRRGYQILATRFSELVRRKLASDGKLSIKLYLLTKDRTTNIEYLVPISFVVNMINKSTDVLLD